MKLLLRNRQAPGDVLMLTAAVRDLHRAHPGRFETAVDTAWPELWLHNPFVARRAAGGRPDRVIDCEYPLVHDADRRPFHFLHGFSQDLERKLGVPIPAGPFRGDLYLSAEETERRFEPAGEGPYWVVVAGGKRDFTAKWWDPDSYQAVVDHFRGRIRFVQCGAGGDFHPRLRGAIDLVGRTGLREFLRVVYHADGVLCPVTFAMHAAAAVPRRPGSPALKPCVVVAGGREPAHWEMYPGHQFLHTIGALDCCAAGGCWKSRCQPLGDGAPQDAELCVRPRPAAAGLQIGQCMSLITPARVIDAIEMYFDGGVLKHPAETASTPRGPVPRWRRAKPAAVRGGRRGAPVAVTIGVGPYARVANLAAREVRAKTGLPTVVLTERHLAQTGLEHPAFLKFRLFDLVDADDLLYFDADMVCLDRWEPQALFGGAAVVGVRERMVPLILRESAEWCVPPDEHFNTGMFIASRRHHGAWLRRAEALRFLRPTALNDQLPLNAARRELRVPLQLLDRRFNWLGFGAGSLSHDMPVVLAHKLVPERLDPNVAYLAGRGVLGRPTIVLDPAESRRVSGRTFSFRAGDGTRRPVRLREDGTVLPAAAPDEPGYWFVQTLDGRPTLTLASETAAIHLFQRTPGGSWVGVVNGVPDPAREGPRLIPAGGGCCDGGGEAGPAINEDNARAAADAFVRGAPPFPRGRFRGRGIVVCGGGAKYFPCAWVCVRMLRHVGCRLPIELWHLAGSELSERQRALVEAYGVRCVNADDVRRAHPVRRIGGWELKPFALLHSAFREVLLLDADNVAVRDPSDLFEAPQYRRHGAVFWPDFDRLAPDRVIWRVCGVPYRHEPEVESGQLLVDKRRCWAALQLAMHLNEHSDFYYDYVHGDKETFHMAWRMLGQRYAMVRRPIVPLESTMCQHDFGGRRLFQHRNMAKWVLGGGNAKVPGFLHERRCLDFLDELAERLGAAPTPEAARPGGAAVEESNQVRGNGRAPRRAQASRSTRRSEPEPSPV